MLILIRKMVHKMLFKYGRRLQTVIATDNSRSSGDEGSGVVLAVGGGENGSVLRVARLLLLVAISVRERKKNQ